MGVRVVAVRRGVSLSLSVISLSVGDYWCHPLFVASFLAALSVTCSYVFLPLGALRVRRRSASGAPCWPVE